MVTPEKLEGFFLEHDMIDQIYLHGDREKSVLIAVVKPKMPQFLTYLSNNNLDQYKSSWASSDDVRKAVLKELCEIGVKFQVLLSFSH